ncbi:MAG TPA: xanthine dehydrogenase family protein subunit M [Burkholderiales bacterium]|nr:xanthine dehydrogenase family protein subunit M [Burkholderiales bacterium]
MRTFDLVVATTAQHALEALARHGPRARVLAGGTDLLVELKAAAAAPEVLVDISRVEEFKALGREERGLVIGALVTHAEIARSELVCRLCPALAEAARRIGAEQTRNLGTLGGNLASAVPCMDTGPALMALDARIVLASLGGRREMPLEAFFVGPRRTRCAPGEILCEIVIPESSLGKSSAFRKAGLRRGQAIALANASAALRVDPQRGVFLEPRIALGAVAPTVMRAREAESFLDGRAVSREAISEAARIAAAQTRPISDFRASSGYRRELTAVLVRRVLEEACDRARGGCGGAP